MKTDITLILLPLISALIIGCSEEFQEVTPTVTTISKETPTPSAKTAISEPTATVTPLMIIVIYATQPLKEDVEMGAVHRVRKFKVGMDSAVYR